MSKKSLEYQIYHPTYTSAISEVMRFIESNGYDANEDDIFNQITTGKSKPIAGDTNRHTLLLYKGDKPIKKAVHFQVYNRETKGNPFELNAYFSTAKLKDY